MAKGPLKYDYEQIRIMRRALGKPVGGGTAKVARMEGYVAKDLLRQATKGNVSNFGGARGARAKLNSKDMREFLVSQSTKTQKGATKAAAKTAKAAGIKTAEAGPWDAFTKSMKNPKVQGGIAVGMILHMLMGKLGDRAESIDQTALQSEALQSQGRMATPDSYYYEAALPRAQERESQAAAAVMGRLAGGGVLGPSLAQGEYSIGG